ncbi:hypothetical protein JV173_03660 [Acholeplasma equirhinis]|uniref:hypothetical protein n=1 Tax=Acholeplasma equirhinis TaxID=555393 RepID=UPI00197AA03A|nr:hypothetical protein [Acholeplasma equirhinis]MBN3490606.1 hypothetical protein [Acholeplasma equirhinis]
MKKLLIPVIVVVAIFLTIVGSYAIFTFYETQTKEISLEIDIKDAVLDGELEVNVQYFENEALTELGLLVDAPSLQEKHYVILEIKHLLADAQYRDPNGYDYENIQLDASFKNETFDAYFTIQITTLDPFTALDSDTMVGTFKLELVWNDPTMIDTENEYLALEQLFADSILDETLGIDLTVTINALS